MFADPEDAHAELYDARLYRLYLFYLAASLTMFRDAPMGVYQIQYLRSRYAAPITRNYMVETEDRYRALPNMTVSA